MLPLLFPLCVYGLNKLLHSGGAGLLHLIRYMAIDIQCKGSYGVDKFTIKSGKPFIVPTGYGERKGQQPRVMDINEPLRTVVSSGKFNLAEPVMTPFTFSNTGGSVGSPTNEPAHTIRSAGGQVFASAQLMSIGQTGGGDRIRDIREPVPTTVSKQEACVVAANLIQYHTEQTEAVRASGLDKPIQTVDAANR